MGKFISILHIDTDIERFEKHLFKTKENMQNAKLAVICSNDLTKPGNGVGQVEMWSRSEISDYFSLDPTQQRPIDIIVFTFEDGSKWKVMMRFNIGHQVYRNLVSDLVEIRGDMLYILGELDVDLGEYVHTSD